MLLNLSPLKENRDFRFLFLGQSISFIGSMINYVAVPYQIYEITKSNALVAYVSLVELIAILAFGVIGGAYADRLNRRKVMLTCEVIIMAVLILFSINSFSDKPSVMAIFIFAGILQSANAFHRPAMDAITQKIVQPKDFKAVAALGTFKYSVGAILGPTVAGFVISFFGFRVTYFINFVSFALSFICLYLMKHVGEVSAADASASANTKDTIETKVEAKEDEETGISTAAKADLETNETQSPSPKRSVLLDSTEGLKFAIKNPVLLGTYIIDIIAMIFAFPVALYPALSEQWGGARTAGFLYSSMAIGALVMSIFSRWTEKVTHHGRAVVFAAAAWAVFIVFLGFTSSLYLAVLCLVFAGAADTISGIFRSTIWNETIPNQMRGRMSGIEMISYTSGPLLGNVRAGLMATAFSVSFSIWSGGVICLAVIVITTLFLTSLWLYQSKPKSQG